MGGWGVGGSEREGGSEAKMWGLNHKAKGEGGTGAKRGLAGWLADC